MKIDETLDYAIMRDETLKNPNLKSGYIIDGRPYGQYLDNKCFDDFINDMKTNYPIAYKMYGEGSGSELELRKSRWGTFSPPKMASFGSSSRMIFNLMKDTKGFLFEKQLPTTVGGTANLDGFMETDDKYIFVEAKCREPYGKKDDKIYRKYEKLYNFINQSEKTNVSCDILPIDEIYMKVTFKMNDNPIHNFDMKQMISHLLGVATAFLNGEFEIKNIEFIYLLFNPTLVEIEDKNARSKIHQIYKNTCNECNAFDFKALFEVIIDYLKSLKKWNKDYKTNDLTDRFTFKLCSQEDMKV